MHGIVKKAGLSRIDSQAKKGIFFYPCMQTTMTSYKLSLQTTPDSFPFAALVLASYVGDAIGVSFDFEGEDGKSCSLTRTSDATTIDEAETVVRTLAKAAGMEGNSTQVCALRTHFRDDEG